MERFLLFLSIGSLLLQGGIYGCHALKVDTTDPCNAYCFSMTKPLLDYLNHTKERVDAHDQIKAKIFDLENQIKAKNELISNLQAKINADSVILGEKDDQLSLCRQQDKNVPDSCPSSSSGIHQIQIRGAEPFKVDCVAPVSGWTVIQRRFNGSVDFNRNWDDYKHGFGELEGEFFLGLEKLHLMTEAQPQELHIQLRDINGSTSYARYDNFKVGSETEGYSLKSVGKYTGTAGDSLSQHEQGKFFTLDGHSQRCVKEYDGPWWYPNVDCGLSSLNGKYFQDGVAERQNGISWGAWKEFDISLTFVQMMIRPNFYTELS